MTDNGTGEAVCTHPLTRHIPSLHFLPRPPFLKKLSSTPLPPSVLRFKVRVSFLSGTAFGAEGPQPHIHSF